MLFLIPDGQLSKMHIVEDLLGFASLVVDQLLGFGLKLNGLRLLILLSRLPGHSKAVLDQLLGVFLFPDELEFVAFIIDVNALLGSLCPSQSLVNVLPSIINQTFDLFLFLLLHEIPEFVFFGDFIVASSIRQHFDLMVFLKVNDEARFVTIHLLVRSAMIVRDIGSFWFRVI